MLLLKIWVNLFLILGEYHNLKYEYITILSDRDKGLSSSVKRNFENASHNKCSFHIYGNLIKHCGSHKDLKAYFYKCASATTVGSCVYFMGKIKEIGEKYFSYLSNIPKNEWVTAYQTLPTYMYSSSSCAESFNSLILPYRCDSYDSLLLEIRNLFIKRKLNEEQNFLGKVTDIDNYEKKRRLYNKYIRRK